MATTKITSGVLGSSSITSDKLSGNLVVPGNLTVTDNLIMDVGTVSASATQTQVGGTALTTDHVLISTCATAGDSVTLPSAVAGRNVCITNSGAAAENIERMMRLVSIRRGPQEVVFFWTRRLQVRPLR
jgi:hypothetical protein